MSDWKKDMDSLFRGQEAKAKDDEQKLAKNRSEAEAFCSSQVVPAFEELKEELEKHDREVRISPGPSGASLLVEYKGNTEFEYSIHVKVYTARAVPVQETRGFSEGKSWRSEGSLRSGLQDYTIDDITKEDIITNFLSSYRLQVHWKV